MHNIESVEKVVYHIRQKLYKRVVRMDADGDNENQNQQNKGKKGGKKSTGLGTRLPYGLCKDLGIDTTGMSPKEAWDAYYGETGVSPKDVIGEKVKSGGEKINPLSGKTSTGSEEKKPSTKKAEERLVEEEDRGEGDKEKEKEEQYKADKKRSREIDKEIKSLYEESSDLLYHNPGGDRKEKFEKVKEINKRIEELKKEKQEVDDRISKRETEKRASVSHPAKEIQYNHSNPKMQEYDSKVPKPVMATGIKSLNGWSERASAWGDRMMDHNEMLFGIDNTDDLVKVRDKFQSMVDNAELLCNVNSKNLESIVTDHLMNQFETGTTGGSSDLRARREAADTLFGLGRSSAADREKYGYMMDKGNYEQTLGSSGPSYGYGSGGYQCAVVMKKDKVADRTTYTADDSLFSAVGGGKQAYAAGAVDKNVSLEGMSYESGIPQRILNGEYNSLSDMVYSYGGGGISGYFECQFHGDIAGSDIEAVRFKNAEHMKEATSSWSDNMWSAVKANKIRVEYFDDDKKVQSGFDDDYNPLN